MPRGRLGTRSHAPAKAARGRKCMPRRMCARKGGRAADRGGQGRWYRSAHPRACPPLSTEGGPLRRPRQSPWQEAAPAGHLRAARAFHCVDQPRNSCDVELLWPGQKGPPWHRRATAARSSSARVLLRGPPRTDIGPDPLLQHEKVAPHLMSDTRGLWPALCLPQQSTSGRHGRRPRAGIG